jgi:hypothetical protein
MNTCKKLFDLSYIKDLPYYLNGNILYTQELDPRKYRLLCVPFGKYDVNIDKITLYDGWEEKLDTRLRRLQKNEKVK